MNYYRCKYFELYELFSPEIYFEFVRKGWINTKTGDGFAWCLLDERALKTLDKFHDVFGRTTVNNWWWYYIKLNAFEREEARKNDYWEKRQKENTSIRIYSGYRSYKCKIGTEWSDHRKTQAYDTIFRKPAHIIRNYIFEHPEEFEYITTLEIEISWVHFSVRNYIWKSHADRFNLISRK